MTKRSVKIDDELLARAGSIARSRTIKATVDLDLRRLVDEEKAMRHVARLRGTGALDLARLEEARRPPCGRRAMSETRRSSTTGRGSYGGSPKSTRS